MRSTINICIGNLPKVVSECSVRFDIGVSTCHNMVVSIGGNKFSLRIWCCNISPLIFLEEILECFPVRISRAVRLRVINSEHPKCFNLQGRRFPTIPQQELHPKWLPRLIWIVLNNLKVGNAKPCSLIEVKLLNSSIERLARLFSAQSCLSRRLLSCVNCPDRFMPLIGG